jgi:hypothetical protein
VSEGAAASWEEGERGGGAQGMEGGVERRLGQE